MAVEKEQAATVKTSTSKTGLGYKRTDTSKFKNLVNKAQSLNKAMSAIRKESEILPS